MSKRTGPICGLAVLMLFVGGHAFSRPATSTPIADNTVLVRGPITSYDPDTGCATIGDSEVFVGDVAADLGIDLAVGDDLTLLGMQFSSAGLIWAISIDFPPNRNVPIASAPAVAAKVSITGTGTTTQRITGTGIRTQSITGTGKQSITGTGIAAQSITGTGIRTQSITGTGIAAQSITGTGIRAQSITGTGIAAQSITGTGIRTQSITGTGISAQSITGTGIRTQSITGTGIATQSITGTGYSAKSLTGI